MILLDGRIVAQKILDGVRAEVEELKKQQINPKLAVILVGEDPRSLSYIREKLKACDKTGILYQEFRLKNDVTTEELVALIEKLNVDKNVHGILVQLPLPAKVSAPLVIRAIEPKKDVDGFQAYNLGKMFLSAEFESLAPCTPVGIIKLLEFYKIPIKGQDITVIGHSNIVGKPLSIMLLNRNATVTTCHIDTKDVKKHTSGADIVIVAVGKPNILTANMIKDGAVVIDVGCNSLDGRLVGDCDFEPVSAKASYITPVPGGVGPMTVACLISNVVKATKNPL